MAIFLGCGCEVSELQKRMLEPCEQHRPIPLRDWFAGQALAHAVRNADTHFENAARIAYQIADAMIVERAK